MNPTGCIDEYVEALMLTAMAPAALEVSLAAAEQAQAHREQVEKIWAQRLERADIAVARARRQYQLAEPENRLVVRQLEKDWEVALADRERLGRDHDRFTAARPRLLSVAEHEQIRALATHIAFDAVFATVCIEVIRTGVRAPRQNSVMERWFRTQRAELTDRTLVWNLPHLMRLLREYEEHYNTHRPHRALGQAAPARPLPDNVIDFDDFRVRRRDRAGGVIHEYRQVA